MTQQIRAALRAAIFQALATLGEAETKKIVSECLSTLDNDHWGRTRGGR
jgi:hypothetical protein